MKRKYFYLVNRKDFGCYPEIFTSIEKAEIFAKSIRDSFSDFDVEFVIIPCIPDAVSFNS